MTETIDNLVRETYIISTIKRRKSQILTLIVSVVIGGIKRVLLAQCKCRIRKLKCDFRLHYDVPIIVFFEEHIFFTF